MISILCLFSVNVSLKVELFQTLHRSVRMSGGGQDSNIPSSGLSLIVRGSQGLCLQAPPDFTIHQGFPPDLSKSVKVFGEFTLY